MQSTQKILLHKILRNIHRFSNTIIKSSTLRNKNIDVAYRARPFPYSVPICHLNWTPVRARCKHADSHH